MRADQSARTPQARLYGWPFLCVFGLALAYTLDLTRRLAHFDLIFWDAKVYARAIRAFATGGNPYTRSPDLNFVYSPTFLRAGCLLSHVFPGHSAWYLYLLLSAASVFAIPLLLSRGYLRARWMTPAVATAIFFFHPLLTAQTAFTSANIATPLYALLLAAGIRGLRRNRWLLFYLAVACGSVIKPTLLAFLLLPFLMAAGQLLPSIAVVLAVSLQVLLERHFAPTLHQAFVDSVYFQIVTLGDAGFGLLSHLRPLGAHIPGMHQTFAYVASFLILAALVFALWLLRRTRRNALPEHLWVAVILVTAILANPRLLAYDAAVAVLPATLIVVDTIAALVARRVSSLAIVLPLTVSTAVLAKDPKSFLLLFLFASVLVVIARLAVSRPANQAGQDQEETSIPLAA